MVTKVFKTARLKDFHLLGTMLYLLPFALLTEKHHSIICLVLQKNQALKTSKILADEKRTIL